MPKPIETFYNGYRFRSRLEARWAVFFDVIGEPYQYELEGFNLNGLWYLPDFFLPRRRAWVEIKPHDPDAKEWQKVVQLAKAEYEMGSAKTAKQVWVIIGEPWAAFDSYGCGTTLSYVVHPINVYDTPRDLEHDRLGVRWTNDVFVECRQCDYIGLEGREYHFEPYLSSSEGGGYGFHCTEKAGIACSRQLYTAYLTARQAQFEHYK